MAHSLIMHPLVSPRYYGYYIDGFRAVYGRAPKLSTAGFPELKDPKDGLAAILPDGRRIFIAANDFAHVDPDIVEWADVVGQVNVDPTETLPSKVVPLGPSFGTPWISSVSLIRFIIASGLRASPARIPAAMKTYLRHQQDRVPLSQYVALPSAGREVFFIASYWINAPHANRRRLHFVQAVTESPGLTLNGGFWSSPEMPAEFHEFRIVAPVDHSDYVRRTQRSVIVFNTPAVHDCLGWKLGEFLALGKAIISTPLGRVMPGDFRHGEHIHIVEEEPEAIREAVALLVSDVDYRHHLERSAREYWERWLAPVSVVRRITA